MTRPAKHIALARRSRPDLGCSRSTHRDRATLSKPCRIWCILCEENPLVKRTMRKCSEQPHKVRYMFRTSCYDCWTTTATIASCTCTELSHDGLRCYVRLVSSIDRSAGRGATRRRELNEGCPASVCRIQAYKRCCMAVCSSSHAGILSSGVHLLPVNHSRRIDAERDRCEAMQ